MADGWLSTHILDTARGVPAAGIKIMLYRVSGNSHKKIAEVVTNADGLPVRSIRWAAMSWCSALGTICAKRGR